MTALVVEGLHSGYGPVKVLHDVSFSVEESGIMVILGANGAGKTTTLRAISGMIPWKGKVELFGEPTAGLSVDSLARLGIAHVPEGRGTFGALSVEENLKIGALGKGGRKALSRMDYCYSLFPRLAERKSQHAGRLSGGEQQMLAIARALMSEPRILLLDEPSLGLAPLTTRSVFAALEHINRESGLTIIVVEQNADLALSIGTNALVLASGHVVTRGVPAELAARDDIRRAYLGV